MSHEGLSFSDPGNSSSQRAEIEQQVVLPYEQEANSVLDGLSSKFQTDTLRQGAVVALNEIGVLLRGDLREELINKNIALVRDSVYEHFENHPENPNPITQLRFSLALNEYIEEGEENNVDAFLAYYGKAGKSTSSRIDMMIKLLQGNKKTLREHRNYRSKAASTHSSETSGSTGGKAPKTAKT